MPCFQLPEFCSTLNQNAQPGVNKPVSSLLFAVFSWISYFTDMTDQTLPAILMIRTNRLICGRQLRLSAIHKYPMVEFYFSLCKHILR